MTRSISGSSATSTTAGRAAHELELDTEQARGLAEAVPAAIEEHPQGKEKLSGQLEGAKASQASRDAVRTSEKTLPIDDPEKNAGKGHGDDGTILVDWDGPDDPENPLNWSNKQKWLATTIISLFTFSSPFASTFISVPSQQLRAQFGITNTVVLEMCTSVFLLAYALGPLIIGPLSEIFGRLHVLQISNALFILFNFVNAWAPNTASFIVFRFLAGFGGSAPLSIGGAFIGDVWRKEERGKAAAIYGLCPLLAPTFGPLLGAFVDEYSSWRWVFWSTTIFMVLVQVVGFFILSETYAPVLLERKAKKLRSSDPNNADRYHTKYLGNDRHWKQVMAKGLTRPFTLFAHEPIIQVFSVISMLIYGEIYLVLTTVSTTFMQVYHWKASSAGLIYIALGIGVSGASQAQGRLMDVVYRYMCKKNGGKGKPEYRLILLYPPGTILAIGYLIYGWTVQYHQHWIAPAVGLVFIGAGMITFTLPCILYTIDAFTLHAASALAAMTCLRSLCGFAFPLFGHQMFAKLGMGGGSSLLAGLSFAFGVPAPFILIRYGERLRMMSKHAQANA